MKSTISVRVKAPIAQHAFGTYDASIDTLPIIQTYTQDLL